MEEKIGLLREAEYLSDPINQPNDSELHYSRTQIFSSQEGTQRQKTTAATKKAILNLPRDFVYILLLIILGAMVLYYREADAIDRKTTATQLPVTVDEGQKIPKVLWLFTEFQLEGEKMLEQVMGHYLIHVAEQSGWEVRKVTSLSAYQHISQQTQKQITFTMQHMLIEEQVNDLLRLALLMDNGGIMLRVDQAFPVQGFSWLKDHFIMDQEELIKQKHLNNQVLLFQGSDVPGGDIYYQDFFLAAIKGAQLIVDSFQEVSRTISSGKFTFTVVKQNSYTNSKMNSTKVKYLTRNSLHSWLKLLGSEHYHAKVLQLTVNPDKQIQQNLTNYDTIFYLQQSKQQYHDKLGIPRHFMYFPTEQYRSLLQDELERVIDMEDIGAEKDSYWADLMSIPYNERLYEVIESRSVHYCIIDAHQSSNFGEIQNSFEDLKKQSYRQWTAIYFSGQDLKNYQVNYMKAQQKQNFSIVLSKGSRSVGRNYQLGIIKLCPDKSFILVLKAHERLIQKDSLMKLVQTIQPRNVLGAYVTLNITGQIMSNDNDFQDYHKSTHNGMTPQYEKLQKILNHLRVFHSDCYKIIPQFDLRNPQGQYFDDRFIFLENYIYMTNRRRDKCDTVEQEHTQKVKWFIKSSRHLFDIPFFIYFHQPPLIKTNTYEEVNRTQLSFTFFRNNGFAMMIHVDHLVRKGQTMKQFAIFNPGNEYEPYALRHKPQRIPKIIHQIWVGGPIKEGKKYLIEANRELYPDWEHKLWLNENITRENFPLSYDLIQTLIKVNQFTRFSRMATVADVMRHEIMYREGGFYMDTSMKLFKDVFNQWLSYRVVIPTVEILRHRWYESMCLFGNEPKYPGLLRIISSYNTNRYNIYRTDAMQIAGPYDFRQYIQGYDEYDPDVLIMGFDTFYPMDYRISFSYYESMCAINLEMVKEGDEVVFQFDNKAIISNCGKYYPYSFGKEVSAIGGGTWQNPRQ